MIRPRHESLTPLMRLVLPFLLTAPVMIAELFARHPGTLVLATLLLVVKGLTRQSLDRWFAIGYVCLVASALLVWQFATTDAWDRIASLLL